MVAVLAAAAVPLHAFGNTGQPVEFPGGEVTLKGTLFKPDGRGPFPSIVAMHGCEGLTTASGALAFRYQDWAHRLTRAGFALLFPDSYASRHMGNQCRTRSSVRTDRERMNDAEAARKWLQTQNFAKPDHISLLGWSNGAISVLWTVRPRARPHDGKPDFRSAAVLYPGCRRLDNAAWAARVPTLILIGRADDVVSAHACELMVAHAYGRSARAKIIVYPGAFHDFDHPRRKLQRRSGYAYSTNGSGHVHTGTNAAARTDALYRVPKWLGR
jgi:dienelactone hydrolase